MMRARMVFAFATAMLLAGCSDADWDHAFAFAGLGDQKPRPAEAAQSAEPARPAEPAEAAAPVKLATPDEWCAQMAKAAASEAADQGFDTKTQKMRAEAAFQQCAHTRDASQ